MSSKVSTKNQDPPVTAVSVTYDCFYPAAQPVLRKPQGSLPLQKDALLNLEWASAFLDHAGHLVKNHEQKHQELEKQNKLANTTISQHNNTINQLKKNNLVLDYQIEHLHADLARKNGAYKKLEAEFNHFRSQARTEKESLIKAQNAAKSRVKYLESQLSEAGKEKLAAWAAERQSDIADRQILEKEQTKNIELQEKLVQESKQLSDTREEVQAAKDRQTVFEKQIKELKVQITQLEQKIAEQDQTIKGNNSELVKLQEGINTLTTVNNNLSADLAAKTAELNSTEKKLADAQEVAKQLNDTLVKKQAFIEAQTEELYDQKKKHQKSQDQLSQTNSEQLNQIDALIEHDKQDEAKLAEFAKKMEELSNKLNGALADDDNDKRAIQELSKKLNEALADDGNDKRAIQELSKKLNEALADDDNDKGAIRKLKTANDTLLKEVTSVKSDDASDKGLIDQLYRSREAALKIVAELKAEREVDETVLPNDVKLYKPTAIVGSLKGSPRTVDDEAFYVNCSFPVTLFGARSHKIYISTNGLFTLDNESKTNCHHALPYRPFNPFSQLPDYVLAPFWANLCVYENTPQGVYYQETGSKPNRKLEVEWYISRSGSPKEHYHFTLSVEEAKPNLATFKYFELSDKGGNGTIGVQGPKTAQCFSYNKQQKDLPGTQLTFDTEKNTFTTSRFDVAANAKNQLTNGKDIKTNGSSVLVTEVAVGV